MRRPLKVIAWLSRRFITSLFKRIHSSTFLVTTHNDECITVATGDEVLLVGSIVHAMRRNRELRNLLSEAVAYLQDEEAGKTPPLVGKRYEQGPAGE